MLIRRVMMLALLALAAISAAAHAEVRLPGFFNDHMVMQRQMPLPVWGWAAAGEKVTVKLGEATASAVANASGKWRVALPAMKAGGPHTLTVSGANTITINDVLIGEVWLCSGQSNMEWAVRSSLNPQAEIAAGNHPQIRHIKIPRQFSGTASDDIKAPWQVATPETVGNFTAAGYFMARELHKELGVPIGLINASAGGTRIEPWTPPVGFESVPALASIAEQVAMRSPDHPRYQAVLTEHIAALDKWLTTARNAAQRKHAIHPSPAFPDALKPPTSHQEPVVLYNTMIHALVGYPIRGAIWYQGESNHGEGMLYAEKKKALIGGWRKLWNIGDFPFYYVQIAPYQYGSESPNTLAEFWEAQAACERMIPGTGMVVTNDIATINDIHPPNKQEVGRRLALLALNRTYGKSVVDTGPTFKSLATEGDALRVTFDHADGLKSRDGKPLTWFEIIGPGSGWKKADARIDDPSVVLTAEGVKAPTGVRFAWHKLAEPNLVNSAGLPTAAFRAGEVPRPDFLSQIGEAKDYTLVYDLDLAKLRRPISYDVDRSGDVKAFDRIAYLLEVQTAEGELRYAWISMDAFTDSAKQIGVPDASAGVTFQRKVAKMNVASNVPGITTGSGLDGGNIEFWPHNYAPHNRAGVPGAANDVYDTGDDFGDPVSGYGSMQIHNHKAGQTILAINNHNAGGSADIGIGNSDGKTRDWTFTGNASSYPYKRLRVFVRPR